MSSYMTRIQYKVDFVRFEFAIVLILTPYFHSITLYHLAVKISKESWYAENQHEGERKLLYLGSTQYHALVLEESIATGYMNSGNKSEFRWKQTKTLDFTPCVNVWFSN